ncbi:MAG: TonB-dependent receptor [Halieaceae bacterium]
MKYRPTLPLAALAALVSSPAFTQPVAFEGNPLEEIVITASRTQQRVFDSPVSLSVIDEEALAHSTAYALADLLRDVPGVQVTDSGQPGHKRIRMRGEESRRSAILINSQELTDHYEVGTPLTLHPAMVERIEVIRGSGSVLYGSKALSGVVNFMTKKGGTEPVQVTLSGSYDAATDGYTGFGSVYGNLGGVEYRVAYADSDHDDRKTPQGKVDNTSFDSNNAYVYLGKNFGSSSVDYTYENYESSSHIFVEEEVKTSFPLTDFYLETPQRDRERHSLAYNTELGGDWIQQLQLSGFYQESNRHFYTRSETIWYERDINSDSDLTTGGGLLQLESDRFENHHITAGLQYLNDSVDQTRHVDTFSWTPTTPTGVQVIGDEATIETWALFLQDEWNITDRTSLVAGLRQYQVDVDLDDTDRESLEPGNLDDDDELIGSLGLVYDYSDSVRLRATASQGYVYPSLMQLATGAYAGSRFVNPAADLDPETSDNFELGIRLQAAGLVVDAVAFYSESDDYIHHLPCTAEDQCPGRRDRLYQNVGESRAHGVETFVQYLLPDTDIMPYMSMTWMKRRNDYADFSTWDSGVPDFSGNIGLRWRGQLWAVPRLWTDLYLRGETSSEVTEPGSSRTVVENRSSWTTLNIAGGLSFGSAEQYQLALELNNLTDETYVASGENLYGAERSVSMKVTMDW